jgi:hypothetical protein
LLDNSIKEYIQTYQFIQPLEAIGLIMSIHVLVQYKNPDLQTLKGLTIDE